MNKGFTMIELLAVIIILSGIMLISIPTYNEAAYSVKERSFKNKTDAINSSMLKFAKLHLIDEIKPAGELCTNQLNCCRDYDLYKFVLEYGLYPSEEKNEAGEDVVIDPLTNDKLNGCVRISYDKTKFSLKVEFIKDRIINAASAECRG